ncbi:hypothetical protein TREES_T100005908, partial [Tupaia chinensis]
VFQGRHVKTGQLAAIKVMDVTEVPAAPSLLLPRLSMPDAVDGLTLLLVPS